VCLSASLQRLLEEERLELLAGRVKIGVQRVNFARENMFSHNKIYQ
jgi:hypothetical protein